MNANRAVAFALGVLFAIGLALGGMTDPAKVRGFLDFTGSWDPSLMFVMAGGVGVYALFSRLVQPNMDRPVLARDFRLPSLQSVDRRLLLGAAIFGVGWGLGGVCPGPAFAASTVGGLGGLAFIVMMIVGMLLVPRR